jgi:hypothetical protein
MSTVVIAVTMVTEIVTEVQETTDLIVTGTGTRGIGSLGTEVGTIVTEMSANVITMTVTRTENVTGTGNHGIAIRRGTIRGVAGEYFVFGFQTVEILTDYRR